MKILVLLDSQEESLEFNGQQIPLNGLGEAIQTFGNMFGLGRGCPMRKNQ